MGGGTSYHAGDRTSLVRGLGASIRDFMRPTREQIAKAWSTQAGEKAGQLGRQEVLAVLGELIDLQMKAAQEEASRVKMDMARQQAKMERDARAQRTEVLNAMQSTPPTAVERDSLDRSVALVMGSGAGPVMAGMMAGYMDIPVTCLGKMKGDTELLEARVDYLFRASAAKGGLVSMEDFARNYLEFFDNAPQVLHEGEGGESKGSECSLQ
mmetsp:Transcript_1041/g.3241  ORF Transcript_1041/g.3241 Transcript_1041/m.3241 type:complete len:211 (+) Transcript_1041:68-700(+)